MSEKYVGETISEIRQHTDSNVKQLGIPSNDNRSKIVKTVKVVDGSTAEIVVLKLSTHN